jgi:hypothetical protein
MPDRRFCHLGMYIISNKYILMVRVNLRRFDSFSNYHHEEDYGILTFLPKSPERMESHLLPEVLAKSWG